VKVVFNGKEVKVPKMSAHKDKVAVSGFSGREASQVKMRSDVNSLGAVKSEHESAKKIPETKLESKGISSDIVIYSKVLPISGKVVKTDNKHDKSAKKDHHDQVLWIFILTEMFSNTLLFYSFIIADKILLKN
jgi:hypothetical protein